MKSFSVYVERPTTSMFSNGEKREFCAEFEDKADAEDYVFDKFYYEQKFYNDSIRVAKTEEIACLLYTSPSPRDGLLSRMPSSA